MRSVYTGFHAVHEQIAAKLLAPGNVTAADVASLEQKAAKYQQQMADKQKSLDEAKTKLNNVQDEAHKAGAPNSVSE